ncbi:EAL domain-containing protein [Thermoleophilia bacterium SCSIO 60948]|nr:EAL domain-containing protein [Thermoleophilia bacterium SCSIO 60948]
MSSASDPDHSHPLDPLNGGLALRALEASDSGVFVADARERGFPIVWVNAGFEQLTGYPESMAVGRDVDFLHSAAADERARGEMADALTAGRHARIVTESMRRDGTVFSNELWLSPVAGPDGRPSHYLGILNDVSETLQARDEVRRVAHHDPLTGLANRSLLLDRIDHACVRLKRRDGSIAVLFCDLDGLKAVNDSFGHTVGDELLVEVTRRIADTARTEDTIGRLGGDEFVVLLEDVRADEGALGFAERLIERVREPFEIGGETIQVSLSIGIAIATDAALGPAELLSRADNAMYRAKAEGGSRAEVFDGELMEQTRRRLRLSRELRRAIHNEQLMLHFQPIIEVSTNRITAVEALARWRHPVEGWIAPGEFIGIAEETGLIGELGEWVIGRALSEYAAISERLAGAEVGLSINVSPRQLARRGLGEQLEARAMAAGVPISSVAIEITEEALVRDADGTAESLWDLRERGFRILLDDFGAGFSSIGHLRRFPIDGLKIDRSFVAGLGGATQDAAIVAAILPMAKALGIDVVAEGVETNEQLAHLLSLGCREAQGFRFAHPTPAGELVPMSASLDPSALGEDPERISRIAAAFREAIVSGSSEQAIEIIREGLDEGIDGVILQASVIGPALHWVGEQWELGRLGIADEHLATAISDRALNLIFERMRSRRSTRRAKVLLAAVQGEQHVLGLRMTSDAIYGAGFEVDFLGADVPHGSLMSAIVRLRPDVVCMSATMPGSGGSLVAAVRKLRATYPDLPVVVGGAAVPHQALDGLDVAFAESPQNAVELVGELTARIEAGDAPSRSAGAEPV